MNNHDMNILAKSTLIVVVTTVMIQLAESRPQVSVSVLAGYMVICWTYAAFIISVKDVTSKQWSFVMHPVFQLALWIVGLMGIGLATEGWRVFEPMPSPIPWILISVAFTVASRDGWKWFWYQVVVR